MYENHHIDTFCIVSKQSKYSNFCNIVIPSLQKRQLRLVPLDYCFYITTLHSKIILNDGDYGLVIQQTDIIENNFFKLFVILLSMFYLPSLGFP